MNRNASLLALGVALGALSAPAARAGDAGVKTLDRAALRQIERFALRQSLGNVEQNDIAQLFLSGEVSQGAADIAGADEGYLLACHVGIPSFAGVLCQLGVTITGKYRTKMTAGLFRGMAGKGPPQER